MIPSRSRMGIALVAVLVLASPGLADEDPSRIPGRGSLGGQVGVSSFYAAEDYSEGAEMRFAFSGNWRYNISPWLRWQISPGFTWTGYSGETPIPFVIDKRPGDLTKAQTLALLAPVSVQVQALGSRGRWHYHAGAGPGLYRVWVQHRRDVLKDPHTFRVHRGVYPGLSAQVGVERFLRALTTTSLEATLATHWVFARRNDQFPLGYNSSLGAAELRIGANYYFIPGLAKKGVPTGPSPSGL